LSDAERPPDDPYSLQRFVDAQRDMYDRALTEIRNGHKTSHWMWFVFPQMIGLGSSPMARRFGISGTGEARAYLAHPVLGARLRDCAQALLEHNGKSAHEILGSPDDLKLRSSATLFADVSQPGSVFHQLLDRFFDGQPDARSLTILRSESAPEIS
jgi:uncharacterized protein (DUF1810 family)